MLRHPSWLWLVLLCGMLVALASARASAPTLAQQVVTATVTSTVSLPALTETITQTQTVSVFSDTPFAALYEAVAVLMAFGIVLGVFALIRRKRAV